MAKQHVYVVQRTDFKSPTDEEGTLNIIEVHASIKSANAGAKAYFAKESKKAVQPDPEMWEGEDNDGGFEGQCWTDQDECNSFKVEIKGMELKDGTAEETKIASEEGRSKAKANTKAKAVTKPIQAANLAEPKIIDENEDDNENDDDERLAPAKKKGPKKAASKEVSKSNDDASSQRKQIPEGKPDALKGLKVLFTGTFDTMDRGTSIATAEKYGAKIVKKLEDTDYVIMGVKAGPQKIKEIQEKDLKTVDEKGFLELLKRGVPKDNPDSMVTKAGREPPKKKQKN